MKAKKLLTLLYLFFIIGNIYAQQEEGTKTFAVKNYFSLGIEKADVNFQNGSETFTVFDSNQVKQLTFFRPAFTIFLANKRMHEFELLELKIFKEKSTRLTDLFNSDSTTIINGDFNNSETAFSFRYQYSLPILKRRGIVYLGGSLNPYYSKQSNDNRETEISERIDFSREVLGVNIYVVPHWMLPLNDNLFLDFRASLAVLKLERVVFRQSISGEYVKLEFDINEFFPSIYEFSLGIGYKF